MPTWNGSSADVAWIQGTFTMLSDYWGYPVGIAWWEDVQIPRGATILSATLTHGSPREGSGQFGLIAHDSQPEPTTGTSSQWTTAPVVGEMWADGSTSDVAAMVQAVVDRPGWASGNNIAFRGTTGAWRHSSPSLTIVWEDPTQEIDPVVVTGHARVSEVLSVDTAVNPALVVAHARVSAAEIVAPRAVYVNPLDAHARVGQASLAGTGAAPYVQVAGVPTAAAEVPSPTLSRTLPPDPPPTPWRRLVEDPAYHEALSARERRTTSRTEIISPSGAVLARLGGAGATHPGALSGTVTCDGRTSIRWTCDLVLDNPDLMPSRPGDLLHPLSHNRVRIWWGIWLPDGTLGEIPVGTYHPDQTPTSDDGATLGVVIRGSSAVAEIKRARWDVALDLSDLTISDAIAAILTDRAPWVTVAVTPTSQKVPTAYEPGEPGGDPWADVERLAAAAGMVAYEDRMGVVRVDPRPTPSTPRATFVEGAGTSLLELPTVEVDLDHLVNRVTVASASPDVDPPVSATVSDDDPSSPLWVGLGHLYSKRVENAIITTEAAARTMAANILADRAPVVTVQAMIHPHPHLDPYDTVAIGRARAGVAGDHSLVAWTLGLAPGDEMNITATTRKEL